MTPGRAIAKMERERLGGSYPLASALYLGRLSAGVTQREVETRSGVDFTNVCRFEKGVLVPGRRALERLAAVLGLPYGMLAELAVRQGVATARRRLMQRYGVDMEGDGCTST